MPVGINQLLSILAATTPLSVARALRAVRGDAMRIIRTSPPLAPMSQAPGALDVLQVFVAAVAIAAALPVAIYLLS